MKLTRSTIWVFALLLIASVVYRIIPNLPAGAAPQLAMAIFGGAVISDKRLAIAIPLLSMFLSDVLFHFLHMAGLAQSWGFYPGQWANYLVFVVLTLFGTLMKRRSALNIVTFSVAGSMIFFLLSNFITWKTGMSLGRPQTFEGLMLCYGDAIAYYRTAGIVPGFAGNFIIGELLWSAVLFGGYELVGRKREKLVLSEN